MPSSDDVDEGGGIGGVNGDVNGDDVAVDDEQHGHDRDAHDVDYHFWRSSRGCQH